MSKRLHPAAARADNYASASQHTDDLTTDLGDHNAHAHAPDHPAALLISS
jgi:hypothetical protein